MRLYAAAITAETFRSTPGADVVEIKFIAEEGEVLVLSPEFRKV